MSDPNPHVGPNDPESNPYGDDDPVTKPAGDPPVVAGLPVPAGGDAGKSVVVNEDEDGYELGAPAEGTSGTTVILTQAEYDALDPPDPTTTYLIRSA